jgi:hypothetical protein
MQAPTWKEPRYFRQTGGMEAARGRIRHKKAGEGPLAQVVMCAITRTSQDGEWHLYFLLLLCHLDHTPLGEERQEGGGHEIVM